VGAGDARVTGFFRNREVADAVTALPIFSFHPGHASAVVGIDAR